MKVSKLKDGVVVEEYDNVVGINESICPTHIHLRFEDSNIMIYVVGFDIKLEE